MTETIVTPRRRFDRKAMLAKIAEADLKAEREKFAQAMAVKIAKAKAEQAGMEQALRFADYVTAQNSGEKILLHWSVRDAARMGHAVKINDPDAWSYLFPHVRHAVASCTADKKRKDEVSLLNESMGTETTPEEVHAILLENFIDPTGAYLAITKGIVDIENHMSMRLIRRK